MIQYAALLSVTRLKERPSDQVCISARNLDS